MLLLTAAAAAAAAMASSGGNNSAFQPGQIWLDSSGNAIRAHSAGLLPPVKAGEAFVWYGADNYTSGDVRACVRACVRAWFGVRCMNHSLMS